MDVDNEVSYQFTQLSCATMLDQTVNWGRGLPHLRGIEGNMGPSVL